MGGDKDNKNSEVHKALTPEENTMLSNVVSMLGELINSGGGAPNSVETNMATAGMGVARADDEEKVGTTEDMKESIDDKAKKSSVNKELETTESDSATANDDAEETIEETQTPITEEGVDEVSKALTTLLKGAVRVKKEAPKNPLVIALEKVAEVQKSTQNQINILSEGFSHLMEGIGITEQINVSKAQEPGNLPTGNPITAPNNQQIIDFISGLASSVNKSEVPNGEALFRPMNNNNTEIRKSLNNRQNLAGLVANKELASGNVKF